MLVRLLKETQKTQPLSLASFSAVGSLALGGAEDPNALAQKIQTRSLARNDRLIKKQRTRKALEQLVLLGGIASLRTQDVIAMERHGSDEGIGAHRLIGNLNRSGIGDSHRSRIRVEATLILLRS